jgi:hypothetical protein
MCDCQDDVNITSIPVGPTGPQGPQGPAGSTPTLGGTSLSNITVGTGSVGFVLEESGLGFLPGQRVSAVSADLTKIMSGVVTSYALTDLVVNVDYTIGAGANADWTIAVTGEVGLTGATGATGPAGPTGATGATGANAFTTIDSGSTPLGAGLYQIDLVNSSFAIVDMVLFVEDAGYYKVTITGGLPANNIVVLDLGYAGNSPADLITGKAVTPAGIQGANGTNGTNGFNYETTDGNNIPAEATGSYQFLMRNVDDTGYTFITLADLKVLLNSIP